MLAAYFHLRSKLSCLACVSFSIHGLEAKTSESSKRAPFVGYFPSKRGDRGSHRGPGGSQYSGTEELALDPSSLGHIQS